MQRSPTNGESRAEYARVMGCDLGCLSRELRDQLVWLQHKWSEFEELFGKAPERIELLNKVASNFFYFLHKLLFEDAMPHLCRLTDPPRTGHHESLTLMRLADSIPDEDFRAQVRKDAEEVRKKCEFARKWRNKRLAHTDLNSLRNEHVSPLPGVTSKNVEDALESFRALLDSVEQHYGLPPSLLYPDPWGAKSLVHYLEEAVRAKDSERERWRKLAESESGGS